MSTIAGAGLVMMAIYIYFAPTLPDTQDLLDTELQTPLRVYTRDGRLISEFGTKRRNPIRYEDTPQQFIDALLASEDDAYFEHFGIDIKGLARAAFELLSTGRKRSGGSTITMQVAKNYYLSSEKTFSRKFTEILLALKIERALTKQQILELYLNKIYLGKRAYGIEAAAQVYYGKSIQELNLAQKAMIAGLPQAPSAANPINNPERAVKRRNYVLARMRALNLIEQEEFEQAARAPVTARYHGAESEITAPYVAEMARQFAVQQYGADAYTAGYHIYTSIDSERQLAANQALQRGLLKYDRDHGWRATGTTLPVQQYSVPEQPALEPWLSQASSSFDIDWPATLPAWQEYFRETPDSGILQAAVVSRVLEKGAWIYTRQGERYVSWNGLKWARRKVNVDVIGNPLKTANEVLTAGMTVWFEEKEDGIHLAQQPEVEGALVSLDPQDGGIQALVGGFAPASNSFNRAIQSDRQPGSAFKPFVYSAALANGLTAATIINDAPVVFNDAGLENTWRPQNVSGKFYGPTRLRQALYKSQNLVSIRILKRLGPQTAIDFISPFGIPANKLNRDLSLSLGASAVSPMELATGYAVFANGGYAITPYVIDRLKDDDGNVLFQHVAEKACDGATSEMRQLELDMQASLGISTEPSTCAARVIDERTHFLIMTMMQDVIRRGTGKRALALGRNDLAGKTGTTNDQKDAWFAGFNPKLATTVWVGFDQPQTLGRWAYGSNTALPIWVDYMQSALQGVEEVPYRQPEGIVSVRIDPETGLLAPAGQSNAIFEYFRAENVPTEFAKPAATVEQQQEKGGVVPEQLF
ncbi:penicillin-binding protein 1A [Bacterioplanes sanyensis]|nr:penicillin-binding protein 1A [Bacterioplanes sanyensis]